MPLEEVPSGTGSSRSRDCVRGKPAALCLAVRPRTCKSFDPDGSVILVSSFSKTLASGYRVGWTVPGRWFAKIDKLKSLVSVATATPTQWAVGRFLETGGYQRHLRTLRQRLADQVGAMAETVARAVTRLGHLAGGR